MGTLNYPQGDGHPDCPICGGRGVRVLPKEERPPKAIGEITSPCSCVVVRDVILNMERGWKGLSKAAPIPSSPLVGKTATNLKITASGPHLKEHLRHVAARMGPYWNFIVVSDAALMDAWLSKGLDVVDADVVELREDERQRTERSPIEALSELVKHPALLIVCLGVKAARNSAMPEVLLETLTLREFDEKPTWIVDQPTYPLMEGHISFSPNVGNFIDGWETISLEPTGVQSLTMESRKLPPNIQVNTKPRVPTQPEACGDNIDPVAAAQMQEKAKGKKSHRKGGRS